MNIKNLYKFKIIHIWPNNAYSKKKKFGSKIYVTAAIKMYHKLNPRLKSILSCFSKVYMSNTFKRLLLFTN